MREGADGDMNHPSIEARVERLERLVEELHARVVADSSADATARSASPTDDRAPIRSAPVAAWRSWIWDSELWLNKLGVGLVLFGITFLFKYSIDQGWLTPAVRVGFGLLVGAGMLSAGLRLGERQRSLAQVLAGGGIAVFYIVGFAAFQLYELVGYATAFAFMIGVTLAAFYLAVRADQPVLSLIGVKGALGTPFLLYSGAGNFPWLVAFTCLVVAAAVGLYWFRGWRSVLWTAFAGGWAVLAVAYSINIAGLPADAVADRWILQAAALFLWSAFALLPAYRESRSGTLPDGGGATPNHRLAEAHVFVAIVATALLAATSAKLIWTLSGTVWGLLCFAGAAGYAAAGGSLIRRGRTVGAAHLLAFAVLLPLGTIAALSGEWLYLALVFQAACLHLLSRRQRLVATEVVAHAIFLSGAVWFAVRMDVAGIAGTWRAATDALVIALAAAASTQLAAGRDVRVYRFAVHVALLAWLWRELSILPGGAAYVSAAWAAYGLALLVTGLRLRSDVVQKTALATLVLLVAKLFVVDLAALEALWRILLFLGVGGVFLLISYLLQGLWQERARVAGR
jgi:uncharacterized membrane protein